MKYEPYPLQFYFRDDPWKVLVCCTLINRTRGSYVKGIIDLVFGLGPDPSTMLGSLPEIREIIRPSGFVEHKLKCLKFLSEDLLGNSSVTEIAEGKVRGAKLRGVGKYGLDSVRIFCLEDLDCEPTDKILIRWVEFVKGMGER